MLLVLANSNKYKFSSWYLFETPTLLVLANSAFEDFAGLECMVTHWNINGRTSETIGGSKNYAQFP